MGDILELWVVMLIMAFVCFAPLGYFIYKFMSKNAKPFGETEPHGDSPSLVNDLAETAIHFIKGKLAHK